MRYTLTLAAIAGLGLGACGKKEDKAPAGPIAQISKPEADKPATPPTPSAPDKDREFADEADRKAPANRTETIQQTLASMEKGDFREAFRYLDKGVDWTEVGLPDGKLGSIDEVIAYENKARTGFSDIQMKAKRILQDADYQVVEYIWSAKHTGAFSDGTAATGKVATLPGAMLIRYKPDGLIDKVWNFLDWPNALQQLGLAPGLPEDFKAMSMPTEVDVVIGRPADTTFRERYVAFMNAIGPDQYKATFAERTTPDFAWWDLRSGTPVVNYDGTSTYFADRRGAFARDSNEIEMTVGSGAYFAAYMTNKLIYKGGYLGVPPDDQKITTHTLDIVAFDKDTMRLKTLSSYGNSYEILAGLGLTAGAASPIQVAAVEKLNIDACDDYVEDMRECLGKLEPTMRESTRAALDGQVALWRADSAKGMAASDLEKGCKASSELAKRTYATTCPSVDWD